MAIYPQDINDWLRSQIPESSIKSGQEIKFDGIQENVSGELVNIPVVYGYRRVTGPRVFTSVKSNNSRVLYAAIAISEGPITKYHKLFIDDQQINLAGVLTAEQLNGGDHRVTTGTYANILTIGLHRGQRTFNSMTGTNSGPTSPILTRWTGNAQDIRSFTQSMAGIAYVALEMIWYENSPFKSFPKITVEISGRTLRNSSVSGFGSESNVFQNANPADVLLDYITNTNYGQGMADTRIDASTISALRTSLDIKVVPYVNGTAESRLMCNAIVDTGRTVLQNVNDLCRQFNVVLTLANGVYKFIPEYRSSSYTMTVDKTNLIGEYRITYPDLSVKYNTVNVSYSSSIDSFTDRVETVVDTAAVNTDGKVLDITVDCPAITDSYMAARTAETILQKSRNQRLYAFKMNKEALRVTVGDLIIWDPLTTGNSTTYLRVIELNINNDFTVDVKAVTHDDSFYPPFTPGTKRPKIIEILPEPQPVPIIIDPVPPIIGPAPAPVPVPQPPPPRPITQRKRKVTVLGAPFTTTNPPILIDTFLNGSNFYPIPVNKISNQNTSVEDSNYQMAHGSKSFSFNLSGGNYGNFVAVTKEPVGSRYNYYYDYRPNLFFRERDLDNIDLGGEGIIIGNGGITYDRIHYVYEIEYNKFGWYNIEPGTLNSYEKIFFDPELGTSKDRIRRVTNEGAGYVSLLECYRGNVGPSIAFDKNSKSYYGCPFLVYSNGSYVVPPAPNGYLGLKYFIKYVGLEYGQIWSIPALSGGTPPLSKNIWENKQTATDIGQLMKIKYFLINTKSGDYQYVTQHTINLHKSRPGDAGMLAFDRNNSWLHYREVFGKTGTPFTKI